MGIFLLVWEESAFMQFNQPNWNLTRFSWDGKQEEWWWLKWGVGDRVGRDGTELRDGRGRWLHEKENSVIVLLSACPTPFHGKPV